jgi:CheY-like chemotaxis protein
VLDLIANAFLPSRRKRSIINAVPAEVSAEQPKVFRILIVDDSGLVRKMVIKLMTRAGHECMEADDGDTAVDIIRSNHIHRIDIILMDYQMPRMLGTVAAEIIRNELNFDGVILGVTGNATAADIDEFRAMGVDEVIVKPLTLDNFSKTLSVVKSKGPRRPRSNRRMQFGSSVRNISRRLGT